MLLGQKPGTKTTTRQLLKVQTFWMLKGFQLWLVNYGFELQALPLFEKDYAILKMSFNTSFFILYKIAKPK